jgi:hypothetical protein
MKSAGELFQDYIMAGTLLEDGKEKLNEEKQQFDSFLESIRSSDHLRNISALDELTKKRVSIEQSEKVLDNTQLQVDALKEQIIYILKGLNNIAFRVYIPSAEPGKGFYYNILIDDNDEVKIELI